jgi:hypothetical protein
MGFGKRAVDNGVISGWRREGESICVEDQRSILARLKHRFLYII